MVVWRSAGLGRLPAVHFIETEPLPACAADELRMRRSIWQSFQAKRGRDQQRSCGIISTRGLIVLCAAGKRRDSAMMARGKAMALNFEFANRLGLVLVRFKMEIPASRLAPSRFFGVLVPRLAGRVGSHA